MGYTGSIHNHTHYSNIRLRDCIIKEKDLLDQAQKLGHKVVGFTDHESISSWIKIENLIEKYPDLKVLRGNEIYLVRNGLNAENYNREFDRYYHFILIARDLVGAKQIMEISTRAWNRSYMARGMRRVPTYYQDLFDIIGKEPGHVIGSTACLGGALPTQLLKYRDLEDPSLKEKIGIWIQQMDNLFGRGNFFLEMQPSNNKDQIYVNKRLLDISEATGIPYIITTDSHYLKKEDRIIHKAYLNAQNGEREVDEFYATTYMMGTEELESYFKYMNRAQLDTAYSNILTISDMCEEYSLEKPLRIPNLKWHSFLSHRDEYPQWFERIPALEKFNNSKYPADKQLVAAVISGIKSLPDFIK
ncbi:MAG: PHP domain-containing protein [Lachnospiraceae bacterium]|nr:PHP domain-containing protein [Lachnospiraceae bacterium]